MIRKFRDEKGMLIIEASIVFPVMFLVIFLLIYTGNAYMQKCRVEAIVNEMAIKGASHCADPLLKGIETDGTLPSVNNINVKPYRYFIGGMTEVENNIKSEITKKLGNIDTGLFYNMKPKCETPIVKFNNSFIYSSFSVEVKYKIPIPIKLLGSNTEFSLDVSSKYDVPVSDVPEFIRNINMIQDYMESYGVMDKLKKLINKAKEFAGLTGK